MPIKKSEILDKKWGFRIENLIFFEIEIFEIRFFDLTISIY